MWDMAGVAPLRRLKTAISVQKTDFWKSDKCCSYLPNIFF